MLIILTWGKEMIMKPIESFEYVRGLKNRLDLEDTDYIVFDSNFLFPLKLDIATRELTESEQIEWLRTEVYPALVEEGKMIKNRKAKYVTAPKIVIQ